ncbi:MAG: hypothetical protein JO019_04200 [Candidatus Kaiserbacteria bacterium]|nr:hypothetical protein [Candidatus Kaiserbacteria bacterium]
MTGPLSSLDRLRAVLERIDEDKLLRAYHVVERRYELDFGRFPSERAYLDTQRVIDKRTGRLISGYAQPDGYRLLTPGIDERVEQGAPHDLIVLNLVIHERVHKIAKTRTFEPRTTRVHGIEVKFTMEICGFYKYIGMDFPKWFQPEEPWIAGSNFFLSEGFTECFAREVMREYLNFDPTFADPDLIAEYFKQIEADAEWALYRKAVWLARALVKRLGDIEDDHAQVWKDLYGAYFDATDILMERTWVERFRAAKIESIMQSIGAAGRDELSMLAAALLTCDIEAEVAAAIEAVA